MWLSYPILFRYSNDRISPAGLPHSAIQGSQDMCSYPWLFAAYHGLLRLVAPRHPPYTSIRLTILSFRLLSVASRLIASLPTKTCQLRFTFPSLCVSKTPETSSRFALRSLSKKLLRNFFTAFCSRNANSKLYQRACPPAELGLIRVELMTPSLSEKCSNRLSYRPV